MTVPAIIAVIGGIALLAAIFGGIESEKLTIRALPNKVRWLSGLVGSILLAISVWLSSPQPIPPNVASVPSPTSTSSITVQPTETRLLPSTDQPTVAPTKTSEPFTGFNFEVNSEGWNTSEGDYKLARVDVTTTTVYLGSQSLQLETELFGNQSAEFAARNKEDVYLHTEATAYFNSAVPEGFSNPGPYNLTGKRVSCYVYAPARLAKKDVRPAYIRIFVKDSKFANQAGDAVDITESNVEQWFELSLVVGNAHGADKQFDPTQVNALGIRLDVSDGSTLSYIGPVFIDACTIEYP